MVRFTSLFQCAETLERYVKHVKWAHRSLGLDDKAWDTSAFKQVVRGLKKARKRPINRPSPNRRQVRAMIRLAVSDEDMEVAAILAIARHFLLRVPYESIPLQWMGSILRSASQRTCAQSR